MKDIYSHMKRAVEHLEILNNVFIDKDNYLDCDTSDYNLYEMNLRAFNENINKIGLTEQIYGEKNRQMILADFIEYIFFGRCLYSVENKNTKQIFVKSILYYVNLLMIYELITVSDKMRSAYLNALEKGIDNMNKEKYFLVLKNHTGKIGLPNDADKDLSKYFDSLLPKTAGGLWHELLVYIFLLRKNVGLIIPLLLTQRILGFSDHIVPPDFLVISHDKRIYGIEVGRKKEIQSGEFSLRTSIPTASIDTENSRNSDRCPICKKWILFCDFAINEFSDFSKDIDKEKISCLNKCNLFSPENITRGECRFTKYSRNYAKTKDYAKHKYTDGKHYHYKCVLDNVSVDEKNRIINAKDNTALITHFPFYSGIEGLLNGRF